MFISFSASFLWGMSSNMLGFKPPEFGETQKIPDDSSLRGTVTVMMFLSAPVTLLRSPKDL